MSKSVLTGHVIIKKRVVNMTESIWPNHYDENFEHDWKMTATNDNWLNMTEKYNKNCHNDEHV